MTIPAHSHADNAFERQAHADCGLEYQSRDNASESTSVDSSEQDMAMAPPPKNFIRRKREERAVCGKITAGAQQSKPAFNWISQARRNAFEEVCAFDLLPVRNVNNNADSLWAQIWNEVTAEDNTL